MEKLSSKDAPDNTSLQETHDKAVQYLKDGDVEQTRTLCQQILLVYPNHPDFLFLLGMVETKEGRFRIAEAIMQRILSIAPDLQKAQDHLQKILELYKDIHSTPFMRAFLDERIQYMDYPRYIAMETTGRCNARCSICPHSTLDRRNKDMSDELFQKVISDLQQVPSNLPIIIFLNVVNEPFLDKKIFQRISHIADKLPNSKFDLYTNFNAIPKDFFDNIWQIKPSKINISFNHANKFEYENSMHLNFDRTVRNLTRLISDNKERKFYHSIRLSRVKDSTYKDQQFIDECRSLFDAFEYNVDYTINLANRCDWLNDIDTNKTPVPYTFPCRQWLGITIFCNGTVPLCCMDARGKFSIGDLNKSSILEIYNRKHFRHLRESTPSRETVYPCNTCSLMF